MGEEIRPFNRADGDEKGVPARRPGDAESPQPSTRQEVVPESQLWTGRTHWKFFAGRLIAWLMGNLVVLGGLIALSGNTQWISGKTVAWIMLAVFLASGLVVVGGVVLRIVGTCYRLTTQRLFISRGILSQTVDQTELIRVDDVRLYKSLTGRLLNVGTVTILTTDATDREVRIEGVWNPEKVAEAIRERMRTLRGKSVYIEAL